MKEKKKSNNEYKTIPLHKLLHIWLSYSQQIDCNIDLNIKKQTVQTLDWDRHPTSAPRVSGSVLVFQRMRRKGKKEIKGFPHRAARRTRPPDDENDGTRPQSTLALPRTGVGRKSYVRSAVCSFIQFPQAMLLRFVCAIVTRSLFILISLIGMWRVIWVTKNKLYWLLAILFLPLTVEMILTLMRKKGKNYKW